MVGLGSLGFKVKVKMVVAYVARVFDSVVEATRVVVMFVVVVSILLIKVEMVLVSRMEMVA